MNKSVADERTYNMNFLKMIYTLYFFQLAVAFILASFAVLYEDSFEWLKSLWIMCIIFLGVCLGLIIACMLTELARTPPMNFIIFLLFTVLFAIGIACFSILDSSGVLYFTLTTQTLIALGFMLYTMLAFFTKFYFNVHANSYLIAFRYWFFTCKFAFFHCAFRGDTLLHATMLLTLRSLRLLHQL